MKRLTSEIYGAVELQAFTREMESFANMAGTTIKNKYEAYYQLRVSELDFDFYELVFFFGIKVHNQSFRQLRFGVPHLEALMGDNFQFYTYSTQLEAALVDAGYDLEKPKPVELIIIHKRKVRSGERNWKIIHLSELELEGK